MTEWRYEDDGNDKDKQQQAEHVFVQNNSSPFLVYNVHTVVYAARVCVVLESGKCADIFYVQRNTEIYIKYYVRRCDSRHLIS